MSDKYWEFEHDWYIQPKGCLPYCVNTEEAAKLLFDYISAGSDLNREEFDKLIKYITSGVDYMAFPKPMIEDPEAAWNLFEKTYASYKINLKNKIEALLNDSSMKHKTHALDTDQSYIVGYEQALKDILNQL